MPGLIVAIVMKKIKNNMKVNFMKKATTNVFFKGSFKKIKFEH